MQWVWLPTGSIQGPAHEWGEQLLEQLLGKAQVGAGEQSALVSHQHQVL